VTAIGQRAVYNDLAAFGDADNAWGFVEFTNGKVWTTHLARTTTNGFEDSTRLNGTKGHAFVSAATNVEIRDKHGVRKRTVPDAFQLFPETFLADITEFANAVVFDTPLTCLAEDAFEAGKICTALQHSYRTGQSVLFDDDGFPILDTIEP
jgi:myo-inositol 2-dehydrogenase/D-chiro-inositol 1-dehydrogenase